MHARKLPRTSVGPRDSCVSRALDWLEDDPDVAIPVAEDPGCFDLVVVGGAAGRGTYSCGGNEPVTMPVED